MLTDTHCHIHEASYKGGEVAYRRALSSGVERIICVGTTLASSQEAIEFALAHEEAKASIGVHPHDTKDGIDGLAELMEVGTTNIVAIGEIGLDYYYTHSPRDVQIAAFEKQLQLALRHNLPVIFHVREAFDDFWPIIANVPSIRGVLHSFTDSKENMERAIADGYFIGVNGISTFTKDATQRQMFDAIPLESMVLETDAPFLTPTPHRGKVNEPAFVRHVAEYHAKQRGVELEHLARVTSANASKLFSF